MRQGECAAVVSWGSGRFMGPESMEMRATWAVADSARRWQRKGWSATLDHAVINEGELCYPKAGRYCANCRRCFHVQGFVKEPAAK